MINVKATDLCTYDFGKIDYNELASRAVLKAIEKPTLVFRDKKLEGIVSFRQALFKRADFTRLKAGKIVEKIPQISPDALLDEVLYLYETNMPKAIAIKRNNKIEAVITGESLFHFFKNKEDVSSLRAGTLSQEVPYFSHKDTIASVVAELRRRNFPYAVVYKNKNYLGIVSSKRLAELLTIPLRKEKGFIGDSSRIPSAPKKDSIFSNLTAESIVENVPLFPEHINVRSLLHRTTGKYLEFVAPIKAKEEIKIFSPLTAAPQIRKIVSKNKFRRNIYLTKFPDLDEIDSAIAHNLIDKMYDKLSKLVGADIMLEVKFKKELSKGVKTKYKTTVRLFFAGRKLQAEASNWNFLTCLQDAFNALLKLTKKSLF